MISQGFEVFKSKLKYKIFFQRKGGKKKNQLKTQSSQNPPALAETKQIRELEKKVFLMEVFFSQAAFISYIAP